MKAALIKGKGIVEVGEYPTPSPKAGEVLLKVDACALCGTDQRVLRGEKAIEVPIIGHEIAGTVVELGAGVTGVKVGGRYAIQAVIGCGHDLLYPTQNRPLAARIAASGAVVSEFGLGEPPLPDHFPRRNRLIAALSVGVLVVEAARRSGSLITARLAAELDADVFAIPGSIDSPLSRGCHQLIRDGAKLVESAQDILDELRPHVRRQLAPDLAGRPADADPADRADSPDGPDDLADRSGLPAADRTANAVIRALGWDPASLDQLVASSGVAADKLASALLKLQLSGRIYRLDDGRFRQMPPH